MNSEHPEELLLQQMAIDKAHIPLNVMEHYNACITCRHTVKKYESMLGMLTREERPVLSARTIQMILTGLPARPMPYKKYRSVILISAGIFVCLCLVFFLMGEYRRRLPVAASACSLAIVAVVVIQEFAERYYAYKQKLDELSTHHQSSLTSLK